MGDEQLDGQEMTVIKTVGDTANKFAQERITTESLRYSLMPLAARLLR